MSKRFILYSIIEFGPLTLFFFVSGIFGFYPGATSLVLATLVTTLFSFVYFRRISPFALIVSTFVLICGTATIYFHDPFWLVFNYTLTNLVFASALLVGHMNDRLILRTIFGHMFLINEKGWRKLNLNWGLLFLFTGIANQIFWSFIPNPDLWTIFRFGCTCVVFCFGLTQFRISMKERLPESSKWGLKQ